MSSEVFPADVRGLTYSVVKSQENSAILQESPDFAGTRILRAQNPRWHWRLEYTVLLDTLLRPNPSLTYTDLQTMMGFCQARYSDYDEFLYSDPDDNFVGPGVITAAWTSNYPYMLGTVVIAAGHAQQVTLAPAGARSGFLAPAFSVSGGIVNDNGLTWQDLGAAVGGTSWPNQRATLQVVTDGLGNYFSPLQHSVGGQFLEDITDLASSGLTVYDNGVVTTAYAVNSGGLSISGFSCAGIYVAWTSQPTGPVTAEFNFYYRVLFEDSLNDFEKFANQLWAVGGSEGSSGKGYLKFKSTTAVYRTGAPAPTWTGPSAGSGGSGSGPGSGGSSLPPPSPGPPSTGPGTPGTDDMLDWFLMQSPDRASYFNKGSGGRDAYVLDTDAAYPVGYPAGAFAIMKTGNGSQAKDYLRYDGSFVYHWITDNNDPQFQAACHAAGYTKCFVDPQAYKRFLVPVKMTPRFFTLGAGVPGTGIPAVVIDSPKVGNDSHRTADCENNFTLGNIGNIRSITTGPWTMSWGGTIGTAPTIQNDYLYSGNFTTGIFTYKETMFLVKGVGRFCWRFFKLVNGSFQLQVPQVCNNVKTLGTVPVLSFPCGPGKPWF